MTNRNKKLIALLLVFLIALGTMLARGIHRQWEIWTTISLVAATGVTVSALYTEPRPRQDSTRD